MESTEIYCLHNKLSKVSRWLVLVHQFNDIDTKVSLITFLHDHRMATFQPKMVKEEERGVMLHQENKAYPELCGRLQLVLFTD